LTLFLSELFLLQSIEGQTQTSSQCEILLRKKTFGISANVTLSVPVTQDHAAVSQRNLTSVPKRLFIGKFGMEFAALHAATLRNRAIWAYNK